MKHFAIGDIHGNFLTMQALLKQLPIQKDDKIVFLGDYIDRGPRSYEVLEFLKNNPQYIYLWGNHEEMFSLAQENPVGYKNMWLQNGGKETLKSFKKNNVSAKNIQGYLNFFRSELNLYYKTDKFIFVHAGINETLKNSDQDDLLWTRNFKNEEIQTVIVGHTPEPVLRIIQQLEGNKIIRIDNGCFLKNRPGYGHLIAYCPEDNLIWQQRNID